MSQAETRLIQRSQHLTRYLVQGRYHKECIDFLKGKDWILFISLSTPCLCNHVHSGHLKNILWDPVLHLMLPSIIVTIHSFIHTFNTFITYMLFAKTCVSTGDTMVRRPSCCHSVAFVVQGQNEKRKYSPLGKRPETDMNLALTLCLTLYKHPVI